MSTSLNSIKAEIESELIRASYRTPLLSPVLNILAALAVASLFVDAIEPFHLLLWLSLVCTTASARIASLAAFRRNEPHASELNRWGGALLVIMGLNAASWGAAAYLLFVPDSFQMQMNLAAFVSVTTVFVTMTTSYMPMILVYQSISMPPLVVMLLFQTSREHYAIALVMGLLSVTTIIIGLARVKAVKQLIYLRIELAGEKESAERANLAKSRFLAAASHDLRQPLHALGIFTAMLSARARAREDREIANHILGSVRALKMLLNALLDISKLDAGSVIPKRENFALTGLFRRLQGDYAPQAAAKELTLSVPECDLAVNSDPTLLETVLRNLLSNAIRYTGAGNVELRCSPSGEEVIIEVIDTGIGIAREHRTEVFREFHQLHNPERDRSKGLGLGLAIVDRLLRLLDHRLDLTSAPGKGSVFAIAVPKATGPLVEGTDGAEETPEWYTHPGAVNLCILVIDDETAILNATRLLLESWGLHVVTAESEKEAVETIAQDGCLPDAIMADLRLRDGHTGIQAIEGIRHYLGRQIPAVIITGDLAPEHARAVRESGYLVLNKPVAPARIRAFVRRVERELENS